MQRHVGFALLALVFSQFGWTQSQSSEICFRSACLHLGMTQNETVAAVADVYDLTKISGLKEANSGYLLKEKAGKSRFAGSITFDAGRLNMISEEWDHPGQDCRRQT